MDPSMPDARQSVDRPDIDLDTPVGRAMTLRDLAPAARDGDLRAHIESWNQ